MIKLTFINCCQGSYFQIHRAGCRDIAKVIKNGQWDAEAESVEAAIAEDIQDQADGSGGDLQFTRDDYRVLPCARGAR